MTICKLKVKRNALKAKNYKNDIHKYSDIKVHYKGGENQKQTENFNALLEKILKEINKDD